jgi:glycosyltransferase involved in cell wall biosynthesis
LSHEHAGVPPTDDATREISDASRLVASPLVSVLMVAYNHAEWIGAAIEGVVNQELPEGFELIIGEDCSSDGTRDVVLAYQARFPALIRVLVSERNVGPGANHARVIAAARGKLLAFCEGDDYWCHPRKLAAQARLLGEDDGVVLVHSDWVRARRSADGQWQVDAAASEHARVPLRHLQGDLFPVFYFAKILRTCTLMMRACDYQAYKADPLSRGVYRFEDTVINAYLTSRGRVAYWPQVSAVYRESPGSLLRSGRESRLRFLRSALQFDKDARRHFAHRGDYPRAYRWELAMGLLGWAMRARDARAARDALADLWRNFGPGDFLVSGWRTLVLRLPLLRRRPRGQADEGAPWA